MAFFSSEIHITIDSKKSDDEDISMWVMNRRIIATLKIPLITIINIMTRTELNTNLHNEEGVCKVRTIRRKGSHEERWNWEEFSKMQGVPWELVPGREGIEVKANIGRDEKPREVIVRPKKQLDELVQRRFRITSEDVLDHDPTPGCPG